MKTLRLTHGSYRAVPGKYYGTPKEVWGFRTPPSNRKALEIAEDFLKQNCGLFKLEKDLKTLRLRKIIGSLGARHVVFQQICHKLRIHRAYVTVHLDNQGRVYMAKNRAVPKRLLPDVKDVCFPLKVSAARNRAMEYIEAEERSLPGPREERLRKMEKLLFPKKKRLLPAYRFRIYLTHPREEWIVYIKASDRKARVLQDWDNLAHFDARAQVFDPNPVIALGDYKLLLTDKNNPRRPPAAAYSIVTLKGLRKSGHLGGTYVKTGLRVRPVKREFFFESHQRGFEAVMAYYHVDSVVRYVKELGFPVQDLFRKPLNVDAYGSKQDNSWYSPGLRLLTFGCGGIDDAEDAEIIVHEFGHALQDAICPDFGQSREAAAMGEGFGDYLAASFFADKKAHDYQTSIMTWDGVTDHHYAPPCIRRVDEDWTFDHYRNRADFEHTNGKIWSSTLWQIREALGHRIADTLIIESHFQLDAFATFACGARAILDADQNLCGGRYRPRLLGIFRQRRIGPVT